MPIEGRKATFQKKNHEVPRHVPKNAVDLQIQKSIIIRDLEALSKAKRKPMGSQRSTTVKRLGDILLDVKGISNSKVLQSEMISKDNAHRRQLKTTSVERKRDKIPNETPGFSKTLPLHERRAPSTAKKQKTYQQIRNEFEYASGGIDLHGDNKTHLKPKPTKHIGLGPRGDTRRDSLRWHDVDSKQRPRSDSPFDSPKPGAVGLPPKKPARLKPIGGIPLIGLREHIFNLSSEQVAKRPKNEQRDNKETISENKQHEGSDKSLRITYTRRHPTKPSTKLQGTTTTTIVDPLTKGIKTEEENQGLNLKHKSETSDKSIGNDTNLLARRVRQIPAKGTKGNFHLVLEEIHELPPLIIKSSELRGRLEELNADYFDKLFSNPNPSILTTMRSSLANSFKGTKKSSKNCYQKILSFFRQKTPDTNQSKTNVKHQLYTKNGTKIIYN